jgi:thioredoxin 1
MLPLIEELTTEYGDKIKVVKMNVDENNEVPGTYGVMSIPTFLFLKGGKVVNQFVGTKSKAEMKKEIDAMLAA